LTAGKTAKELKIMAVTNVNPTDKDPFDCGMEYCEKEEWDKAIAEFDEAIRLSPLNFVIYESRGEAYLKKGDLDHAVTDFNEAIRLGPNDAHSYVLRGITYAAKDNYDAAYADWETVLKMDTDDSTPKDEVKEMIAITQEQRANWSGKLNLAPNLISMALLRMVRKQLSKDFIFMAAGAAVGAVIGILIGSSVLAFFFAGFFGTMRSTFSLIRNSVKTAGESKTSQFFISLVLSVLIAPVWFVIKLVKRMKAFHRMRSLEKTLAKEIVPSAFDAIENLSDYMDSI
jgi:hypothetical protein